MFLSLCGIDRGYGMISIFTFFALVFTANLFALVKEADVKVGQILELNSESPIWVRCDHRTPCKSKLKSGTYAKVMSYEKGIMSIVFADSSKATTKPTNDGFESFYHSDLTEFPAPESDDDFDILFKKSSPDEDALNLKVEECQQMSGFRISGITMGCAHEAATKILQDKKLTFSNMPGNKIFLRVYPLEGKKLEIYLGFDDQKLLNRVEYQFPASNYRSFRRVHLPQVKWLSDLFNRYHGTLVQTRNVVSKDVKRDKFTPFKTWTKPDYKIETGFQKQYSDIYTVGYVEMTGAETKAALADSQARRQAEIIASQQAQARADSLSQATQAARDKYKEGVVNISQEESDAGF